MPALRVPIASFIRGVGDNVRQEFASSSSPAGKLFRSGALQFVDVPLPQLPGSTHESGFEDHQAADLLEPRWDLTPEQEAIVEQAQVVVMDSHAGGPVLLDPGTNLPAHKRHLLGNVEWVQGTSAGVETYLKLLSKGHNAQPLKFQLTRGGGVMPKIMAQYVFGYVTLIERMLLEAKEFQNKREFARMELVNYRSAASVTVGILGLGDIGQGVGSMLRTAGYNVLGFKRHTSAEQAANLAFCADRITTDLDDVLVNSDYLVSVLPSTNATRYLLTEKNLQQCRSRCPVFINIGRGDVISEKTLLDALDHGVLSRAVLDVFEQEPLPRVSGLWSHPSVHLTPHVSGKVFPENVGPVLLNNFNHYLRGEPLEYVVDWAKGY
jgi:phosphoglycerate dehydrogenase-like enzyme